MLKIVVATLVAIFLLSHAEAQAQAYPAKPIRFIIPFGAGSATDALARIVGQELEQTLGQPIIVVQKPGADGALAAAEVKRAAPDGYTLLFGTNSPLAVAPNLQKDPPYNVLTDFTPITFLGDNSFFIVVNADLRLEECSFFWSQVIEVGVQYWDRQWYVAQQYVGVFVRGNALQDVSLLREDSVHC